MSDTAARFPKRARLLKPAEFSRVFNNAIRSSDRLLTILASISAEPYPRLGLAISKKHVKRAVDRNRIKRIVRESFRLHQHQLPGVDFVVMARDVTVTASNPELFKALEHHWKKLCAKLQSA